MGAQRGRGVHCPSTGPGALHSLAWWLASTSRWRTVPRRDARDTRPCLSSAVASEDEEERTAIAAQSARLRPLPRKEVHLPGQKLHVCFRGDKGRRITAGPAHPLLPRPPPSLPLCTARRCRPRPSIRPSRIPARNRAGPLLLGSRLSAFTILAAVYGTALSASTVDSPQSHPRPKPSGAPAPRLTPLRLHHPCRCVRHGAVGLDRRFAPVASPPETERGPCSSAHAVT